MKCQYSNLLRKTYWVLSFFLFSLTAFPQKVHKMHDFLTAHSGSEISKIEVEHLNNLINDIQPTLYFKNRKIIRTDEKIIPVKIITDAASIDMLYTSNSLYENIEIVCIKIKSSNDLNILLRLGDIKGFDKLKCIYFLCSIKPCPELQKNEDCEIQKISNMIQNNFNSDLKILYSANIES